MDRERASSDGMSSDATDAPGRGIDPPIDSRPLSWRFDVGRLVVLGAVVALCWLAALPDRGRR